jgi:aminopeptidase-like protein
MQNVETSFLDQPIDCPISSMPHGAHHQDWQAPESWQIIRAIISTNIAF